MPFSKWNFFSSARILSLTFTRPASSSLRTCTSPRNAAKQAGLQPNWQSVALLGWKPCNESGLLKELVLGFGILFFICYSALKAFGGNPLLKGFHNHARSHTSLKVEIAGNGLTSLNISAFFSSFYHQDTQSHSLSWSQTVVSCRQPPSFWLNLYVLFQVASSWCRHAVNSAPCDKSGALNAASTTAVSSETYLKSKTAPGVKQHTTDFGFFMKQQLDHASNPGCFWRTISFLLLNNTLHFFRMSGTLSLSSSTVNSPMQAGRSQESKGVITYLGASQSILN